MTSSAMSASTARSRRQVGTVASTTSASAGLDVDRVGARGDADPSPGAGRRRLDPDPGEERPLLVGARSPCRAAG